MTTITGSLAKTLRDATLAATGATTITGSLNATLRDATLSSAGTLSISGSAAITLRNATLRAYDIPLQHAIISQKSRNLNAGPVRRSASGYSRAGAARVLLRRSR